MYVEIPSEIGLDGLIQDIDHISTTHGDVMFETILADVFHQFLQVVNLRHGNTAIHTLGVVGNLTLAQIGLDGALGVVCRDAEEGEGTFADLGIDGTEGIDFAQRAT